MSLSLSVHKKWQIFLFLHNLYRPWNQQNIYRWLNWATCLQWWLTAKYIESLFDNYLKLSPQPYKLWIFILSDVEMALVFSPVFFGVINAREYLLTIKWKLTVMNKDMYMHCITTSVHVQHITHRANIIELCSVGSSW